MKKCLIGLLVLLLVSVSIVEAAPRAELWRVWLAHDPASIRQVNHQAVIGHLKKFAEPYLQKRLESVKTISAYEYSWRLNDVMPE